MPLCSSLGENETLSQKKHRVWGLEEHKPQPGLSRECTCGALCQHLIRGGIVAMRMTRLTSAIYEASPPCQDRARVTELRLLQAGLVSPELAGDTAGQDRAQTLRPQVRVPSPGPDECTSVRIRKEYRKLRVHVEQTAHICHFPSRLCQLSCLGMRSQRPGTGC